MPREALVEPGFEEFAYEDGPLSVGEGRGETPRERLEHRCHQFVANLCRSRRDGVHRTEGPPPPPRYVDHADALRDRFGGELLSKAAGASIRRTKIRRTKIRRTKFIPRIVADHIMMQEDFERLREFLLETDNLPEISGDLRKLIEEEWPELLYKLPPKE